MDALVGRIVDTVERQGILDNTIIIYTSDNGTTSSSKGKGVEYGGMSHLSFQEQKLLLMGQQIH